MKQRGHVGQLLPRRDGTGVLCRDLGNAGILRMEGGVQRNLKIAVAALYAVDLTGGTDIHHIGVHDGIGGIVAQKAQHILDLGASVNAADQSLQKGACVFLMHPAAQRGQIIAAFGGGFPDFIAEEAVRSIGARRERRRALYLIMDGRRSFFGRADVRIAFRHRDFTSLAGKIEKGVCLLHTPLF